jgi:hypothetical protein
MGVRLGSWCLKVTNLRATRSESARQGELNFREVPVPAFTSLGGI